MTKLAIVQIRYFVIGGAKNLPVRLLLNQSLLMRRLLVVFVLAFGAYIVVFVVTILVLVGRKTVTDPLQFFGPTILAESEPATASKEAKIILAWNSYWGTAINNSWLYSCPELKSICQINQNRNMLQSASAVVFHSSSNSWFDLPSLRYASQIYVFFQHEPPTKSWSNLQIYRNFFNWTMTYRRDSDIFFPYGAFYSRTNKQQQAKAKDVTAVVANKTKTAAWFVSRCNYPNNRQQIAAELGKYIDLDVYGYCGSLKCPPNTDECFQMLERNYYFYLSFENSICKGYVTEKFFSIVRCNVVPIVLRRYIYRDLVPENSFIAVDDFKTIEELAHYLMFLTVNTVEYQRYFDWKSQYWFVGGTIMQHTSQQNIGFCGLCQALWNSSFVNSRKTVADLEHWWETESNCEGNQFAKRMLSIENQ